MRKLRRILHFTVPTVGVALVIGAVVLGESVVVQLALVITGLLMTEAGLWRLADSVLPDERRYLALRTETEHFITLIRQLNTAATAIGDGAGELPRFALAEVKARMHRSVDRMAELAGMPDDEAAARADIAADSARTTP